MANLDQAFFYNSENGDRVYDADSFEYLLKKFFTSGVFAGGCQVTAGSGMNCVVSGGYACCDGKVRFFTGATTLTLATASATYNRIDTIVVERNDTNREITCKVVQGTNGANPSPKAPVRTGGIYQLVLAEVYVAAGATSITQGTITDKRTDSSVCGYVMCAVDTPDFTELYAQFTAQFVTWFDAMKGQLTTDAAGNLQTQITALQNRIVYSSDEPSNPTEGMIWLKPKE